MRKRDVLIILLACPRLGKWQALHRLVKSIIVLWKPDDRKHGLDLRGYPVEPLKATLPTQAALAIDCLSGLLRP